jgi:uncharacterized protein (DUF302 family)
MEPIVDVGGSAMAKDGLVTLESRHSAPQTIERLTAEIEKRGMTVFARIDHAAAASAEGMELRPTEVLLFGNPRAGTPLMQADQTIGIDLPLKLLVWADGAGKVWLAYNDPVWLGARHGLPPGEGERLKAMAAALHAIAMAAAGN